MASREEVFIKEEINDWDYDPSANLTKNPTHFVNFSETNNSTTDVNIKIEPSEANDEEIKPEIIEHNLVNDKNVCKSEGGETQPSIFVSVKQEYDPELDVSEPTTSGAATAWDYGELTKGQPDLDTAGAQRSKPKSYECEFCHNHFVRLSGLNKHKRTHAMHGEKPFRCTNCPIQFATLKELTEHGNAEHADCRPFKCDGCGKGFKKVGKLNVHRRVHTGERRYGCDICGRAFGELGTLKAHRRTHTGERPYVCATPWTKQQVITLIEEMKKYPVLYNVNHVLYHNKLSRWTCLHKIRKRLAVLRPRTKEIDLLKKWRGLRTTYGAEKKKYMELVNGRDENNEICQRGFTTISKLRVHERTHSGVRPYKCDECGRAFAQLDNLNSHKFTHTGERPFECPTCNKRLRTRSNFNVHIRTHTGERPYVCTICFKVFAEVGSLTVHRRVHTGERPYECSVCLKRFAVNSQWNVHMRIHTGEKPYACALCGKRFTQLGHMHAHRRVHENESIGNGLDITVSSGNVVDDTVSSGNIDNTGSSGVDITVSSVNGCSISSLNSYSSSIVNSKYSVLFSGGSVNSSDNSLYSSGNSVNSCSDTIETASVVTDVYAGNIEQN